MKIRAVIVLFLIALPIFGALFGGLANMDASSAKVLASDDANTCDTSLINLSPNAKEKIHHLFTHALIAHPEIAFKPGNSMGKNYDIDCLTPKEFKEILNSLYERNFCLVDALSVYSVSASGASKKNIALPAGKKPLILSFDDINYYIKKMDMGMADKLILQNGRIGTYTKNAETHISYDNDVVPILENFVAAHPDFSHNGARGIINLTGFDGILGYRTFGDSTTRASEIKAVAPLVTELKQRGWRFSCHSYGHYHMKKISDSKFERDTDKWLAEVSPLVGKTDIYVYPYGENEISIGDKISPKHAKLLRSGFRIFMGVGGSCYYNSLPSYGYPTALIMDRVPLDGNTMRNISKILLPYFDVFKVYDNVRPSKII